MKLKLQVYSELKRVTFHEQICSLPVTSHLSSPKQACRQSMGQEDDSPDFSAQTDSFMPIIPTLTSALPLTQIIKLFFYSLVPI